MKASKVNSEMIGKRCKCIFTGLMVAGTIEEIKTEEYTVEVKVRYDEPHQWGNQMYENGWSFARIHDDFGSLRHLEIIDDGYKTVRVVFSDSIHEMDERFAQSYKNWGVVNLKEWIDNYESSRFTQIDEHTAIITSEYNMEHIREWLLKNMPVTAYEMLYDHV